MADNTPNHSGDAQGIKTGDFFRNPQYISMLLLIVINVVGYNVLKSAKESIFLTARGSGAAALPFIKCFVVAPTSICASLLYVSMRNHFCLRTCYFSILSCLLTIMLLFLFVLFPYADQLHFSHEWVITQQTRFPHLHWFFPIIANWIYSLYYVYAEVWGSLTLVMLFWQTANESFTVQEARRIFPVLSLFGSIGLLLASQCIHWLSFYPIQTTNITAIAIMFAMYILASYVLISPQHKNTQKHAAQTGSKKPKMSLIECIRMTAQSPYVLRIAISITAYGALINLLEVSWKHQVLMLHNTRASYQSFFSIFTFYKGWMAIGLNILSIWSLKNFQWIKSALVTPIISSAACITFFTITTITRYYPDSASYTDNLLLWLGTVSVTSVIAAKYAFFDPTKEMAFIPIPNNMKAASKAAADGLGNRLGKSGGGLLQSTIFSITAASSPEPVSGILLTLSCVISYHWIRSVFFLNRTISEQESITTNNISTPIWQASLLQRVSGAMRGRRLSQQPAG